MIERSSPNSIHNIHLAKLHIAAGKKDEKPSGVHEWTLRLHKNNLLETVAYLFYFSGVWTGMYSGGDYFEISIVQQECRKH